MNHVYVLDFGDWIQIGRAADVPRRIHDIENASGQKPARHFSIEADPIYETLLHGRLSEHRAGEYFAYPYEEAVTLLQSLIAEARVVLDHRAAKYLERISEPNKGRIKDALKDLSKDPPEGDIRPLTGQDGYRVRIGGYRILFKVKKTCIAVYKIAPRGQAYKEN
jgi:mRNA interferase RelE/StbE